jgi:glycerophosphoryl diester phosphodiesterase
MRPDPVPPVLALAIALGACGPGSAPPRASFDAQGHRGARGLLPENTLPAFERALALGVSTLELDTGVTRDGVVVVAHDPWVSPAICQHADGRAIAGERGPLLRDLTLAEVQAYDCGSRNPDPARFPEPPREARPGARIPTLAEVFALAGRAGNTRVRFNVETKLRPGDAETVPAEEFVARLVAVVTDHDARARVSIQSFDWRALAIAKRLAPEIRRVALLAPDTLDPVWLAGLRPDAGGGLVGLLRAARPFADVASPHWRMLVPDGAAPPALSVEALHAEGLPVIPWTVNDEETMRALIRLGVDGLISDYPDRLLEVVRSEGLPLL